MSNGRAKAGGQIGVNGYNYKGGQFLPSTEAPPGLISKTHKNTNLKKAQIAPYKWEQTPEYGMRSIYELISSNIIIKDGLATVHPIIKEGRSYTWGIGHNGIPNTKNVNLGQLLDLYNSGEKWISAL